MSSGHSASHDGSHAQTSELTRVPYRTGRWPADGQDATASTSQERLPSMASREYLDAVPEWSVPASPGPAASSRSAMERIMSRLHGFTADDFDMPFLGVRLAKTYHGLLEYLFGSFMPLRPRTYVDAFTRPNECPEQHWTMLWRWPRFRYVNAKVPPPTNGVYNDIYHFLAFQNWIKHEQYVYMGHFQAVTDMLQRCLVKEGTYNAHKNCKHLANKQFAMSRAEELSQAMMYMSMTGNTAIRETPYPDDFVEQKRKLYDDWLQRTRMRRPGDPA